MEYTKYKELVYQIIGSAMTVHSELNWGLLEPVYQEALSIELDIRNIPNKREEEIKVYYKDVNWTKNTRWTLSLEILLLNSNLL